MFLFADVELGARIIEPRGDNNIDLEKHLYDSWKSIMELYMMNRPHGRMILASVEKGPLVWPNNYRDGCKPGPKSTSCSQGYLGENQTARARNVVNKARTKVIITLMICMHITLTVDELNNSTQGCHSHGGIYLILGQILLLSNTNHDNVNNNIINQVVQVMPSSKQSNVVNHSEIEITSDSNIIPYSQYVIESQQAAVQNSNSSAQQDALILSMIEQLKS
ncbi:hypothetical protein Tco_0053029 [Tanacetum coccineum]